MSNETRWTPGPWEFNKGRVVQKGETQFWSAIRVSGVSLATGYVPPDDVAYANAHLIAAAPELYEALLVAREYLQGFVSTTMREPDIDNLETVDAALAKARGE